MAEVSVSDIPEAEVDDAEIELWIKSRLNDARNHFLRQLWSGRGHGYGRTYYRKKISHTASAPGEYPLTDTGELYASVGDPQMDGPRQGWIGVRRLAYAEILETGGQYLVPRRMLTDALSDVLDRRPDTDRLAKAAKIR